MTWFDMRRWLAPCAAALIIASVPAFASHPGKPATAAVTDGQANVVDCGATPTGGTNDTAAFQSCINLIYNAYPRRGGVVLVPAGLYDVNVNALTFPNFQVKFLGVASVGAYGGAGGALIHAVGNDGTVFNFDGGATVKQSGPTFEDVAIDCGGTTGVTAINLRMTNRARLNRVSISQCATGIRLDAAADVPISGGDSAWHQFEGLSLYKVGVGIDGHNALGLNVIGGDVVSLAGQTGIRWGAAQGPSGNWYGSQWLKVYGMKFDGGLGIDIEGGFVAIDGAGFEKTTTGVRMRKVIPSNIPGNGLSCGYVEVHKSFFGGGVGNQTAVDVGPGCHDIGLVRNHTYFYGPGTNQYLVDASGGGVTVL
jgi:hypothetical protein